MTTDIITTMTEREARQCVQDIRAGLANVGRNLLDLYERDGWRVLGYGSWRECAQAEFGYRQSHTYRLLEAANIERNISPIGEIQSIPESQLRPLTALEPEHQAEAWQRAVETAPNGKITAAHVQDVVDTMLARSSGPARDFEAYEAEREARDQATFNQQQIIEANRAGFAIEVPEPVKPAWYQSSESDDWWTPQWLFDLLDAEIGFETDVCASEANHKCDRFFTREQDALRQEWHGRCWMNPPYGRSGGTSIYQWIDAAYRSALHGATVACFIPAGTDTTWWWDFCIHGEVRFLKGRIKFANSESIAPFPSAIVIFWPSVPKQQAQVKWWNVNGLAPVED